MTLSILFCGGINHMLYDAESEKTLMIGTIDEIETWKHILEIAEQTEANEQHYAGLKDKYLLMLIQGGNSPDKAEKFLMDKMPFLFANT